LCGAVRRLVLATGGDSLCGLMAEEPSRTHAAADFRAPAWNVLCDQIQNSKILNDTWQMAGPLWLILALAAWTALHSTFLWTGMLVYAFFHRSFGHAFRKGKVRRALFLAPLILLPIYGITFVLVNLYWYSVFAHARIATSPLDQVADIGILADVMRIPYFIALLSALWLAIPQQGRTSERQPVESAPIESSTQFDTLSLVPTLDPYILRRFFGLMVVAGLVNAMIAGFLLCRLPEPHAPSFSSLLIRAISYVALGALAGVGGAWVYWKSPSSPFCGHPPIPFALFALVCSSGWVWVPSMVIFSEQVSVAASFVAMVGAFVLGSGLRNATFSVFTPAQYHSPILEQGGGELFAESLYQSPVEPHGYVIAISLYAAGAAILTRSIYTAAALLALSALLFAWKRTLPRSQVSERRYAYKRAALRLAGVIIPAVLVTAWALLDGVAHRNHVAEANAAHTASSESRVGAGVNRKSTPQAAAYGLGGYESVILWPYPEKKQIVSPIAAEDSLLAPGTTRPLIIRFDGPYWYVQPPNKLPGPAAHQSHGTPLGVDIESNNSIPLVMDAHQNLSASIRTARCREIRVEVENRDNLAGSISLALLLTDGTSKQKQTIYLGQQPIVSAQPEHFSFKPEPVFETLRFPVPANSAIRKFSELTVLVLPDIEHKFVAPKIAIQQFQLFPR
jgi:hypothetical protein